MKTVSLSLTSEAIADRGLQIEELCAFLNKQSASEFRAETDSSLTEQELKKDGTVDEIHWYCDEAVENQFGTYNINMDC